MAGGSKPGERRGGRQKGTLNKATADVKIAAQVYTAEAVAALATIMRDSDSDAAKVSAIKELLDRGHGKARQPLAVGGDEDAPPVRTVSRIELVAVSPSDNSPA